MKAETAHPFRVGFSLLVSRALPLYVGLSSSFIELGVFCGDHRGLEPWRSTPKPSKKLTS